MTADNVISEDFNGRRSMILPGAFDGFDMESPVAILVNHDWNRRIGTVGDNAKLWLDGSKLMFTVLLKNSGTSDVFRKPNWRSEFTGCSISCQGFSETRYDRDGRPFAAMSKVLTISDVGPVESPANPCCYGIELTDYSPAPRRAVARVSAVTNSAVKKRRKPLMIVPPMPESMLNGMAIAEAAKLGGGCMVKGVRLSAESVQNLIRSRHQAVH